MVRAEFRPVWTHRNFIGVFFAREFGGRHAFTDLDAFYSVYRHHCGGQICVEFGVNRRTKTGRGAAHHDFDHRANGAAGFAQIIKV